MKVISATSIHQQRVPIAMSNIAVYVLLTTGILNLVGVAGLFYRMSIMSYQHRLMWNDFARRKGLNGHAAVHVYERGMAAVADPDHDMSKKEQ
jgi:hypothetical protein